MRNQIETYIFIFSIFIVLGITIFFDSHLNSNFKNQIILFSIPLLWPGLAHGSLDLLIAERKNIVKNIYQKIFFLFIYILVSILFFFSWISSPNLIFLIFLLISFLHFGLGDSLSLNDITEKILETIIRGSIIISIPIQFHFEETSSIFKILLADTLLLENIKEINQLYLIFVIFISVSWLIKNLIKYNILFFKQKVFLELSLLLFCFYFFEPLISFFTYFCFLHSIRHISDEKEFLKLNSKNLFLKTLPFTLITVIFFLFLFFYLNTYETTPLTLSYILVGLASLTIPHIILVNFIKNKV